MRLDDDDDISVSQNTSKLPSIIHGGDRKSGMSITGNHFGKKFVDLEEQLNSPPGATLVYPEFELVPKMRETYHYG